MVLLSWIESHLVIVGLVISEALALIPGIKSNSIVQLAVNVIKDLSAQIAEKLK